MTWIRNGDRSDGARARLQVMANGRDFTPCDIVDELQSTNEMVEIVKEYSSHSAFPSSR
jgi:hypothetical protein